MNINYRWYLSWRKYWKVFSLGWQEQMTYRANSIFESGVGLLSFVVIIFLWNAVYLSNHYQPIAGMTFQQMLTYIILVKFWSWIIDPNWEIDFMLPEDIRNGGLNRYLIRPVSDRLYRWNYFLGRKILYGIIRLTPALLVIILLPQFFTLKWHDGLWYLPLISFLALTLQFMLSYTIATFAFWMYEIWGILFLKRLVFSFLSGAWIPLTLFPSRVASVLLALPFQYTTFFPIQVVLGKMNIQQIQYGIGVQLIWIGIFTIASLWLWRAGMKQYCGAGG